MNNRLKKIQALLDPESVQKEEQAKANERANKFFDTLKGEKGDKGDMPKKGVDYFTPEELDHFGNAILKAATPIKGVHYNDGEQGPIGPKGDNAPIKGVDYFDGVNGKDGKDGKNGRDGIDGRDGRDGKDGKDGKSVTPKEVIDHLDKLPNEKKLDFRHFKNGDRLERAVGKVISIHGAGVTKIVAGSGITVTSGSPAASGMGEVTIAASSGAGITRTISSISVSTPAASTSGTDYVYLCSGTLTLTLPSATSTNLYTVKNKGSGTVTIATTGGATIEGSATITLPVQYTSVDLISNGTDWSIT